MPKEVEKEAKKQVERLEMMHPDAIESNMLRTYIEWLVELPWSNSTKDNIRYQEGEEAFSTRTTTAWIR